MVNSELLRRKLIKLAQYLQELEPIIGQSIEEYRSNYYIRRTAERLIQLLVEVAVDINSHVLVDEGFPPPPDYYSSFTKAAEAGLLPKELAFRLAPSTGERNILVHEYEIIDDRIIHESIPETVQGYREYLNYWLSYMEKQADS